LPRPFQVGALSYISINALAGQRPLGEFAP
jgi:hypothetical protein